MRNAYFYAFSMPIPRQNQQNHMEIMEKQFPFQQEREKAGQIQFPSNELTIKIIPTGRAGIKSRGCEVFGDFYISNLNMKSFGNAQRPNWHLEKCRKTEEDV